MHHDKDTTRDTPASIRDWQDRVLAASRTAAIAEARAAAVAVRRDPGYLTLRRAQDALVALTDFVDDEGARAAHQNLVGLLAGLRDGRRS
jgi:hypothetical protein